MVDLSPKVKEITNEIESQSSARDIRVSSHVCDVSDSAQVNALFEEIKQLYPEHKVPNVIVNSAGIGFIKNIWDY